MPMLNQDILREATRLTRAGQLVEATLLLQRMLRGERCAGRADARHRSHRPSRPRAADHRRDSQRGRGKRHGAPGEGHIGPTACAARAARSRQAISPGSGCAA